MELLIFGAEGRLRRITAISKLIEAESENVVEAHMQQLLRLRAGMDEKTLLNAILNPRVTSFMKCATSSTKGPDRDTSLLEPNDWNIRLGK